MKTRGTSFLLLTAKVKSSTRKQGWVILRDAERRKTWGVWMRYWSENQNFQKIPYMDKLKAADGFKEREEFSKKKGLVVGKLGKVKRWVVRHAHHIRYQLDKKKRGVCE